MKFKTQDHESTYVCALNAKHPIAPPWGTLAALLVVAGGHPAASSRLASAPHDSPLGRVQPLSLG